MTLLVVLILICPVLVVAGLVLNQHALIPGTRNYARVQQEQEARHQVLLARLRDVEDGQIEKSLKALEVRSRDRSS